MAVDEGSYGKVLYHTRVGLTPECHSLLVQEARSPSEGVARIGSF